ncbi:MAG: Trm112 family protein [Candidatus Krumholzibacteriota bacterium]|nr:Trm112 family protein [Candidatus Krumholzibacteriota bacterium]
MDEKLLALLACPLCHGPLERERQAPRLVCPACRRAWLLREGVPDLLPESGTSLEAAGDADA